MALKICMESIQNLDIAEDTLNRTDVYLAEQYSLYNDNKSFLMEGVLNKVYTGLKKFFRKCINLIIRFWKWIVGVVKKIINKIKSFFKYIWGKITGETSSAVSSRPVDLVIIDADDKDADVIQTQVNSDKDIQRYSTTAINKLSSAISKLSKENVELMKEAEKMYSNTTTESYSPMEEKVVYNTRMHRGYQDGSSLKQDWGEDKYNEEIKIWDNKWNEYEGMMKQQNVDISELSNNAKNAFKGGVSYQGNSFASTLYQTSFNFFNIDKAKIVVESENIVEEYRAMLAHDLDYMRTHGDSTTRSIVQGWLHDFADMEGWDKKISRSDYIDKWFQKDLMLYYDNPEITRKWLKLMINYNRNMIKSMNKILTMNYQNLGISKTEIDILKNRNLNESEFGNTAFDLIVNRIKELMNYNDWVWDLRPYGMGMILINDTIKEELGKLPNGEAMINGGPTNTTEGWRKVVSYALKYDITLLSHGIYEEDENGNGYWGLWGGLKMPDGTYTERVDDACMWIYQHRKEYGFKRVMVCSCNPGYKLPEVLQRAKDIFYQMSMTSTLLR